MYKPSSGLPKTTPNGVGGLKSGRIALPDLELVSTQSRRLDESSHRHGQGLATLLGAVYHQRQSQ